MKKHYCHARKTTEQQHSNQCFTPSRPEYRKRSSVDARDVQTGFYMTVFKTETDRKKPVLTKKCF